MKEEGSRTEVNGEMEGLPKPATQSNPEVGGDDNGGDQVKGNGPECVFDRLAWGAHRISDGGKREPWAVIQEQNQGMQHRRRQRNISTPSVQTEVVKLAVWPESERAVT